MDHWPRYAIYFVPAPESALYQYGSAVLGYDCYTGETTDFPDEFKTDAPHWRELTEEPRRYGFHATLKAPFHLAPSRSEAQLIGALRDFAGLAHAVRPIEPSVEPIGGFIAIVPREPERSIDSLAASCTMMLDAYRAPMSAQERARRVTSGLSASQTQNLDRWGYPYVLAEFRFHMTLAGKIAPHHRDAILKLLRDCSHRMSTERSISVDRLALVKQDSSASRFRVISHAVIGR